MRMVVVIEDAEEKKRIARSILEALPEWFGIPEARWEYVENSAEQTMLAELDDGEPLGFLCLKRTGDATVEIAVMGVLKERHRQGVGRRLFERAEELAAEAGYSFMQVKTVRYGKYPEYDRTNDFYRSMGFMEFEVFPTLWDKANPCQVYVKAVRKEPLA